MSTYSRAWENGMATTSSRRRLLGSAAMLMFLIIIWTVKLLGPSSSATTGTDSEIPLLPFPTSAETTNPLAGKNVAAIVENRPLDNLIPLILHFSSVLGPDWPIHIFTTDANAISLRSSATVTRNIDAGLIVIQPLPMSIDFKKHSSVSAFFTQPWFWQALAPAEKILMFQGDSMICSRATQTIEDYTQYDFIGAPIDTAKGLGFGYNGGLSIRNRKMMLDIVKTWDWAEEKKGPRKGKVNIDYEDQWFWKKLSEMDPQPNLPSVEVAKTFSVETMWYDKPFGYHQASVWQKSKMEEILEWCPEYRLALAEPFKSHS
ncbi:hypothetical protein PVAG01_08602 [Phlyctema vagabunda]|uniref:DUF5672 domain-containing protein n=1 Tax=Phlyctema vagabunda TaxID=108571 RepID=A0ABR4P9W0_9HELO